MKRTVFRKFSRPTFRMAQTIPLLSSESLTSGCDPVQEQVLRELSGMPLLRILHYSHFNALQLDLSHHRANLMPWYVEQRMGPRNPEASRCFPNRLDFQYRYCETPNMDLPFMVMGDRCMIYGGVVPETPTFPKASVRIGMRDPNLEMRFWLSLHSLIYQWLRRSYADLGPTPPFPPPPLRVVKLPLVIPKKAPALKVNDSSSGFVSMDVDTEVILAPATPSGETAAAAAAAAADSAVSGTIKKTPLFRCWKVVILGDACPPIFAVDPHVLGGKIVIEDRVFKAGSLIPRTALEKRTFQMSPVYRIVGLSQWDAEIRINVSLFGGIVHFVPRPDSPAAAAGEGEVDGTSDKQSTVTENEDLYNPGVSLRRKRAPSSSAAA